MPTISQAKRDKISEQILHYLFTVSPDSRFTAEVAKEIARDEEFTKALLQQMQKHKLVIEINKNKTGKEYLRRQRWRLSDNVYSVFIKNQNKIQHFSNF